MQHERHKWSALILAAVAAAVVLTTGAQFRQMHRDESIVPGPGVTQTRMLSDYFPALAGTTGDTEVYILDGEEPGATAFILGGTHPNEPAGLMAAVVLVERAQVKAGRLIVVPRGNRSGFTHNDPQEGSPQYFTLTASDGSTRTFRFGSRATNPLDQWPDPDTYINPSGQREPESEQSIPRATGRNPHGAGSLRHHGAHTQGERRRIC